MFVCRRQTDNYVKILTVLSNNNKYKNVPIPAMGEKQCRMRNTGCLYIFSNAILC